MTACMTRPPLAGCLGGGCSFPRWVHVGDSRTRASGLAGSGAGFLRDNGRRPIKFVDRSAPDFLI